MKNIVLPTTSFLFLLLLLAGTCAPAQLSFTDKIDWQAPRPVDEGMVAPYFENAATRGEFLFLPEYCKGMAFSGNPSATLEASFTSLQLVSAPKSEWAAIRRMNPPARPLITTTIGESQEGNRLVVCFMPYVNDGGILKKVSGFSIEINSLNKPTGKAVRQYSKSAAATSVLDADGWHKIAVDKTGMFKITPAFLSTHNITSGPVAINDLRIVGNGVGMLPEKNNEPRPDDLLEVPLKVFDQNSDGLFNGNDVAVFYARGPHQWKYNEKAGRYEHILNAYRTQNFYFLSVSNGSGAQVMQAVQVSAPATDVVTTFDDYSFVEEEEVNLVGTGREWYGHVFDFTLQSNYDFAFPNLDKTVPVKLRLTAVGRASSGNTFLTATVTGKQVVKANFDPYQSGSFALYADPIDTEETFLAGSDNFVVQVAYNNSANPSGVAWLDFLEVQARRNLIFSGSALYFQDASSVGPGAVADFMISGASPNVQVWEVTDNTNIVQVPLTFANGVASFKNTSDELKHYVAFEGTSGFAEPTYVGSVPRQNLHGLPVPELLIVVHPKFLVAAQRLADFHINNDQIPTEVVTTEQVYNEFSSGGQDLTAIRDFSRMVNEKALSSGATFNSLLLFGDASYDYKDRVANNNNFVPVYEGGSSLNLYSSAITDDYFGYLSFSDGGTTNELRLQTMDIGVGRIPSATVSDAEAYVDKVIHYTNSAARFGDWRNKVLLMADDVDDPSFEKTFVTGSESLTDIINQASKTFNVDKIYSDAYQQVSTTGSETYPEASNDMFRKVQQGNLVTNYIGHGGEIGLSSEKLVQLSDINSWTNIDAMPLFMTITCEFTRLDDPKRVSAGEQLALNPNGGAIALISTTRVVQAQAAIKLNRAAFRTVFERPNNQPKTLGEIIRDTKNDPDLYGDFTKFKFSLIGDPAVRLAIPYYEMSTTSINGKSVAQAQLDTLKALSKVSVAGQVNDFGGQVLSGFNGIAHVSVYDKATQKQTLVNDGNGPPIPFTLRNNLIYRGKVEVKNGLFDFNFLVPKDISYKPGYGKISLYGQDGSIDAGGYMDTVVVGDFNEDAADDDSEGPVVELFINDESFVRGGITDEDPDLYAILTDSSGINTVGTGIGHDLVAILDNETDQSFVINEYYEADLNSYQQGKVRYPFFDLTEGEHSLKLKVFDVYNNFSIAETEFIVAESADMALERVLNYPNPFTTYTEFQFEHNRSDQPLEVQVQIFTVSGKLVKTINQLVVSEGNRVTGIAWNGLDDYGDKIGRGVYVYRVKVRAQLDNSQADKYEKLVILR